MTLASRRKEYETAGLDVTDVVADPMAQWEQWFQQATDAGCVEPNAFALGTVGAGYGATTVNLKGGIGSASTVTPRGFTVAAIAAVNAVGSVTVSASDTVDVDSQSYGLAGGAVAGAPLLLQIPRALRLAANGADPNHAVESHRERRWTQRRRGIR